MRYFLVTFSLSDKLSLGTVCFDHHGFFSYDELLAIVRKQHPYCKGLVVMNIYEFADRADFIKYKGDSTELQIDEYVEAVRNYAMTTLGLSFEQSAFVNRGSMVDYYSRGIPVSEALKDLMLMKFGA